MIFAGQISNYTKTLWDRSYRKTREMTRVYLDKNNFLDQNLFFFYRYGSFWNCARLPLTPTLLHFFKTEEFQSPRYAGMPQVYIAKCLRIWLGFLLQLPFAVQFNDPRMSSFAYRGGPHAELGTRNYYRNILILFIGQIVIARYIIVKYGGQIPFWPWGAIIFRWVTEAFILVHCLVIAWGNVKNGRKLSSVRISKP